MQGPCEQVCKVFLMEEDLGEEVTYDVMEYITAFVACHVSYIILITISAFVLATCMTYLKRTVDTSYIKICGF